MPDNSRRDRDRAGVAVAVQQVDARTTRALDFLNLFVANIQTGFGPFIAVYLTTEGWTDTAIGFALSLGTLTAMVSQIPAGALVDAARSKARVGVFSIAAFFLSALLFAIRPVPLSVYLAEVLHGFSSCTLGPVIAAISLAIAGKGALGLRLGRNARFASIGNGIGAALMGACGYFLPQAFVFYLTALLTLPAFAVLRPLRGIGDSSGRAGTATARRPRGKTAGTAPGRSRWRRARELGKLFADRRLVIFALSTALFTFANAAMLPLAGSTLTKRGGGAAALFIAASIVLPQIVVALISPSVGALAERRGRRLVLMLGFATLPLRGLFFAVTTDPIALVCLQVLDGIAGASLGVLLPLITADIAGRSGHYNLALGFVGFAMGIGATASTGVAGWIADRAGEPFAFSALAFAGVAAVFFVWGAMPETRPKPTS
ncbi:MAG TPA: MFS transporter [Dongiaceae bacterium]|jgi:MFS family permease|nr:MFS transporter [Dongiaceae bacterium]